MAVIKKPCKFCQKTTDIVSEVDLGPSGKLITRACGHGYIEPPLEVGSMNVPLQITQDEQKIESEVKKSLFELLKEEVPSWCETHQRECIKSFETKTGKHLFPYQRDGVIQAYKNNAKFIWNDEMGLGKTIQGLTTIALNKDKLLPALVVCKSIAKTNWLREIMDALKLPAQIIESSSETPFDMFKIHVISFDMMNRLDKMFSFSSMKPQVHCPVCDYRADLEKREIGSKCPSCSGTKHGIGDVKREQHYDPETRKIITKIVNTQVTEELEEASVPKLELWVDKSLMSNGTQATLRDINKVAWTKILQNCQTIILDEVHLLKNPESQRSKALKIASSLIPHKLLMSGTLIKNNAVEYFVPLNIVKPERYWRLEGFCRANVRQDYVRTVTGKMAWKWTGLRNPEQFLNDNKEIMIRRSTDEVLSQLPKLFRQHKYTEVDEAIKKIYDQSEEDFAKWFDNASSVEIAANLLGQMAKLRHQTSLAKVDYTIDLALEFVCTTEATRKLAIFTHHIDSREFLAERMITFFRGYHKEIGEPEDTPIVRILGQSSKDVQKELDEFKNSPTERILILSTLAHGESINLQFMADSILHERQWNPSNEDQAISGRFRRIGQESKSLACMIPIAVGTIDEYMLELIERKRLIGAELDTLEASSDTSDISFVRELAEIIASKGRSKWTL